MPMPPEYVTYPHRRKGMDHSWYEWSELPMRPPVAWPGNARIALFIVPVLQWFPLDMKESPFRPPGAHVSAYPDLRSYTLRDYGNRVGIYRVMKALERRRLSATVAVQAEVARRQPELVKQIAGSGWEIMGAGLDMAHLHHEGLSADEERKLVNGTLDTLASVSGQKVQGWISPARAESSRTLEILANAGVEYVCDWANDDMPYAMRTQAGTLHAMPLALELDDQVLLGQCRHSEDEYREQLCAQFDYLYAEAAEMGGRVMTIPLHPWVIGQPYRIKALEDALDHMLRHEAVWSATGAEILQSWLAQQDQVGR